MGKNMRVVQRIKSKLSSAMPVFTVLGTLGLAYGVYRADDARGGITGFAQGIPETASALESARVAAVHVEVGTEIEAGQLIATLDTAAVDGEVAVAHAEKGRIEAELRAQKMMFGRRLDVDRENIEREARKESEALLELTAESRVLDHEIDRVTKLVAEHQAVAADLAPLSLRRAHLASLTTEKPRTIGILERQLNAASRRRQDIDDEAMGTGAKLTAELLVVQRRIDLLERRRAGLVVRAARKGRVLSIEKQPGEVATAGEPLVKLVSASHRVVACVPERRALGIREGDAARLWVRGQRGAPLAARLVTLGPIVSELPPRCWPNPKLPIWGREITLAIDTPIEVVVGEAFDVMLDGTPAPPLPVNADATPVATKAGGPAADTAPSLTRFEPHLMTMPPALARRTRFEPSGILARPNEGRYLIVSDDTGIKNGTDDGRPWLFWMDGAGSVDAAPVPIQGVETIDDLESITAGDDGEIYVLSSQSRNKHDRRRPARSALLRLRPGHTGFTVDGEVHLAELLEQSPEHATSLGLANGTRDLDIEGMSFHGGALYLGVKAPVDAQGDAMIWKVASPKVLFGPGSEKRLQGAGLAAWGHVHLDLDVDGSTVRGGISDLLFDGDDSLVIASTPSTAEAAAGGLWRVPQAGGGALKPELVRRFPGRKPEGMSRSLNAGKLMIVFDAGSATPSFLEMPWPH